LHNEVPFLIAEKNKDQQRNKFNDEQVLYPFVDDRPFMIKHAAIGIVWQVEEYLDK
jgi:hypothetical protein